MDTFNFKVKGSESAPPIDRQTNHQLLRSKSLYSLRGPTINSPTSDPLDMDALSLLRYPRTAAIGGRLSPSVDMFKSPSGIDCGRFHQMLLHNHPNLSSSRSRGSSSSSPLSAIENLETPSPRPSPLFPSPLKVDEDVLVMDGILVGSSAGGRGRAVLDSGSTSANSLFKTEICRTWEDSGVCRYGSMCQFAHGKEELRPSRHAIKIKAEVCKTYTASGFCGYGAKCRFIHQQITALSSEAVAAISPANMRGESKKKQGGTSTINQDRVLQVQDDWSPEEDGIEILQDLPSYSTQQLARAPLSRQDVNTYISSVLYGPSRRPRLPVFTEFCPQ